MKTMFVIAALSVLMTGCSGRDSSVLSAKDYGEKWPLVADSAKIGCDPKSVAWVEVEGKRYALNGNAIREDFQVRTGSRIRQTQTPCSSPTLPNGPCSYVWISDTSPGMRTAACFCSSASQGERTSAM